MRRKKSCFFRGGGKKERREGKHTRWGSSGRSFFGLVVDVNPERCRLLSGGAIRGRKGRGKDREGKKKPNPELNHSGK